ncbi:hypothetical protein FRC04_005772, partial [Tulasnella sp. 424]
MEVDCGTVLPTCIEADGIDSQIPQPPPHSTRTDLFNTSQSSSTFQAAAIMSSRSAGNQPPTNVPSRSNNLSESNQVSIIENIESLKDDILSILKGTVWPSRSTDAARDFIRIIESASSLKDMPKEETHIPAKHRDSLERFIGVMRSVQPRLKDAATTHGAKDDKFFSNMKKRIRHPIDRSKCTQVLESCRNDARNALATLPDNWNHTAAT